MFNVPIPYQLFEKIDIGKGLVELLEIYFSIGAQNAHNVGLAVCNKAIFIATIDFIAAKMSTPFILIPFNSLLFWSSHLQKLVEISDEEDGSSSEGTAYEQLQGDTSEDDEEEDPQV